MTTFPFPSSLHVSNKDQFETSFFERQLGRLRKQITDFLFQRKKDDKETDFFDVELFNRRYVHNMELTQKMVIIVKIELLQLGWNTHLGFGDTGLYIYSTPEKPSGVY